MRSHRLTGAAALVGASGDADANALIAAMTTPPSGARETLIRAAVATLKTDNTWSSLDTLYVIAAADNQAGRVDWRRPSVTATAVNSPTFTADRGYTFNGTTNYLDLAFTPSTQGVNMTGSVGTFGVWERTDVLASSYHGGQGSGGANHRTLVCPRRTGDSIGGAIQSSLAATLATGQALDSLGPTTVDLTGGRLVAHKQAGPESPDAGPTTGGSTNVSLWIGGYNAAGVLTTPRGVQVAAAWAGNLTDAQITTLHGALTTYMSAVGA